MFNHFKRRTPGRTKFNIVMAVLIGIMSIAVITTSAKASGYPYFNPCPTGQRPVNVQLIELYTRDKDRQENEIPALILDGWYIHPYLLNHFKEARIYQPMVKCGDF